MNCNFDSKKDGNTILVKKQAGFADTEMRIYSVLVSAPPVNVPKVFEVIECTDPRYKVIRYELLVPYDSYGNEVMTNKFITAKYLQNVFDSYMSLISKNVIHCDLKPTNILFNPSTDTFVLSDFDRSKHISDGNLLGHIGSINLDFLRFFKLFGDDFKTKHKSKLLMNETYEHVVKILDNFCGKLNSYNESPTEFSQFTTIEEYFDFIRGYLKKLILKTNALSGGKRRTRKHRHGVDITSHNQNNRKTKLHVHSSIGRKRNLRRKQRVTRSRKF